jgi:ABC-type cobalamin/Fe3+-siderophores transport system ATPase subunit
MPSVGTKQIYFRQLRVRNVRTFAEWLTLDLTTDGRPAQWTLILGDNGSGKTTLLQCLASMRPVVGAPPTEGSKSLSGEIMLDCIAFGA